MSSLLIWITLDKGDHGVVTVLVPQATHTEEFVLAHL